jgi:hypothetical protein
MFVVLQPGGQGSPFLLETVIPIRDFAACNSLFSGALSDRMVCAGSFSTFSGPCDVRSL